MTNYPRDEFDKVPEDSSRHGVHRSGLGAEHRSLWPIVVFGVAALCIGLLAFLVLPRLGLGEKVVSAASSAHTTTAPAHRATPTTSAAPTTTTAAPTTTAPSPQPTPTPTPDRTVPVAVFNATGISGLAAKYAAVITADGWTVSQSANWAGAPQTASVIFYNGAGQLVNARQLAKVTGIPTLVDTAELGIPLAVVLGPGAQ
ncbi:LytR C-terminal domain-containing protein [Specibacter cremeus]|uniref:LytR C-terminal domain-containing protein n=1 Tax=Specibacter cremeus TaxID=1629051 RepID=UPI000F768A46|nr:LytR C-terminal domain-containing protein [Specibacter cremeus]